MRLIHHCQLLSSTRKAVIHCSASGHACTAESAHCGGFGSSATRLVVHRHAGAGWHVEQQDRAAALRKLASLPRVHAHLVRHCHCCQPPALCDQSCKCPFAVRLVGCAPMTRWVRFPPPCRRQQPQQGPNCFSRWWELDQQAAARSAGCGRRSVALAAQRRWREQRDAP